MDFGRKSTYATTGHRSQRSKAQNLTFGSSMVTHIGEFGFRAKGRVKIFKFCLFDWDETGVLCLGEPPEGIFGGTWGSEPIPSFYKFFQNQICLGKWPEM